MFIQSFSDLANPDLLRKKLDRLAASASRGWEPPPRLSVPEWADQFRKLASEAGNSSGDWHTDRVEVARGAMLAVTEPGVHVVSCMVATQVMKSELILNTLGYFMHLDPCPMLLLRPKDEDAEQFTKERINPMIRATPVLRALVSPEISRSGDNTLKYKAFPGGFVAMLGAGSPTNLASRPIRVLVSDEIDKYPITREGNPIKIAEERMASFDTNSLSIRACSPTVEDESLIGKCYDDSDQRRASMECPECGHRMFPEFFKHVEWDKEGGIHATRGARIYCEACGVGWSEGQRLKALRTIRWHQTKPFDCCGIRQVPLDSYSTAWRTKREYPLGMIWDWHEASRYAVYRARCARCGKWCVDNKHAGFQASKLYSPWQSDTPAHIAEKWISAKGDADAEQVWWNTQMGLPHRPHSGKALSVDALLARCEVYDAEVPFGVGALTVGVDAQGDRIEMELVGWGKNEESWSLDYHVIEGEFSNPQTQLELDKYLKRVWVRGDGRGFEIMAGCIDTGGGEGHAQSVYEFCKARIGRRIWAIKGASERNGQRSPVWPTKKPSPRNKQAYRPIILGVNSAKDVIRSRLHIDKPGPGYMHFPADRDVGYFAQLTCERSHVKKVAGHIYRVWEQPPGKANEAGDCRNYAYAALCGLMHAGLKLNKRVEDVAPVPANPVLPQEIEFEDAPTTGIVAKNVVAAAKKRNFVSKLAGFRGG